jgi:hypothetical protein
MSNIIFKQNKKGGGLFNFIMPQSLNRPQSKHEPLVSAGSKSKDKLFRATDSHILDKRRQGLI